MTVKHVLSSNSLEWYTPQWLIELVVELFDGRIWLDPCAETPAAPTTPHNVPAATHYTIKDNGLAQPWYATTVFVNPPYGRQLGAWINKAVIEHKVGNADQIVLLVPPRTDTRWFQQIARYPLSFIRGRVQFSGPTHRGNTNTTPSMIVGIGVDIGKFTRIFGPPVGNVFWPAPGSG